MNSRRSLGNMVERKVGCAAFEQGEKGHDRVEGSIEMHAGHASRTNPSLTKEVRQAGSSGGSVHDRRPA